MPFPVRMLVCYCILTQWSNKLIIIVFDKILNLFKLTKGISSRQYYSVGAMLLANINLFILTKDILACLRIKIKHTHKTEM